MSKKLLPIQMTHCNHNMICSMWIETTGNNPEAHDICEVCFMPLDNFLKPKGSIFYSQIIPRDADRIDLSTTTVTKKKLINCTTNGVLYSVSATAFDTWFNNWDWGRSKNIMLLTHNYPDKLPFLREWLGFHHCEEYFNKQYRDIEAAGIHYNDRDNLRGRRYQHAKVDLAFLGNVHNIEISIRDDIIEKCMKVSQIYQSMLKVQT